MWSPGVRRQSANKEQTVWMNLPWNGWSKRVSFKMSSVHYSSVLKPVTVQFWDTLDHIIQAFHSVRSIKLFQEMPLPTERTSRSQPLAGAATCHLLNEKLISVRLQSAIAQELKIIHDRRKFRSQTSDNMDRWKAEQGRGREKRKIRRKKSRRERVRREKD